MPSLSRTGAVVGLIAIGLLAFAGGLHGGFVFDDYPNLIEDPDWKLTRLGLHELIQTISNGFSGLGGRPLAMLSFGLNHYFTQMDAFPMKATNLALHLVNGYLVLTLCRRLFAFAHPVAGAPGRLSDYAAWAVAVAWVVHPLQVSTVLYVVQRMEIGAATGTLLALLAYVRARRMQIEGRHAWPWYGAAVLATLFGLLFKETAALVPAYAFLIEAFVFRFRAHDGRARALTVFYLLGAVAALALFAGWIVPRYLDAQAYAARDFTLGQRLWTQAPVLCLYLRQIVLPTPGALLFYYDNFPISSGPFSPPSTALALAFLAALAGSAWLWRRSWPLYALGIGWFFAGHALTSNVAPLELAFEHRNYLPLLGILIAAAQVLGRLTASLHTDARRTLALLPIAACAAFCAIQASTWGDPMRMATALASRNIDSPRASFELGRLMLQESRGDRSSPQWSLAQKEFEHAATLPRSSPLPEQALIIMAARSGQEQRAEIWGSFRRKLQSRALGPESSSALYSLMNCRQHGECAFYDDELMQSFAVALERNPKSALLHSMYATFAFNLLRDRDLGVRMMREAVHLAPGDVQFQANLAQFLAATGSEPAELNALVVKVKAANRNGSYSDDLREIEKLRRKSQFVTDR